MTVELIEYEDFFRTLVPGARLHRSPYLGVVAEWSAQIELGGVAANDEHAHLTLRALAEQIRARAARELGLEAAMEGLRRENRALMEANRQLGISLSAARKTIAVLEEQRDDLASRIDVLQEERSQ